MADFFHSYQSHQYILKSSKDMKHEIKQIIVSL